MPSKLNKDIDYNKLPEPIVKSLTELIARIKLILWIRGSLATLAVVFVVILIVMGIDAATIIISPIYRWSLSLSVFVALLIAVYFYLYKPLTQPFSLERVARFVELRHPELQERMSSIVELCRIDKNSDNFGSQQLIDKLAEEATFDANNVKPTQEINSKSVKPWFVAAGFVVGIIVVLMAIWPLRTLRLMARVIAPASDVGSFFADNLEVEPGSLRIVKGEPLTIKVKTKSPKIETAYIIKFEEDGKLVKERMIESTLDPEIEENKNLRVFTLSIPQVNESFRYCIHAGHSLTAKYEVQVEVPPQVDRFDFVYTYPSYTGLGAVLHTNALGNISVLNGTEVNINANLSKPINSAKVIVAGKELADTNLIYISQSRLKCTFVTPFDVDDKWQMNIVDHFGFTNTPKIYSIVSVKDQPPTVDIYRPIEKDLVLSTKGRFVINYFGFDDYGLTNAFLEVTKDGKVPDIHKLKKLEKEEGKEGIWKGDIRFDLSKFNLNNVSKLSVVVCVADALPVKFGGPQIARSEPIIISIDRQAESLSKQSYDMQHDTIKKILENVLKRLEDSVVDAKSINTEMSEELPDYVQVDEDASEVAADLSTASELLDDLLGMLDDTVYVGLKDGVEKAKDRGVDGAKQNAEMIVMLDKDDKKATGRKLRTSLEDSIMMVKNLFEDLVKLDEVVDKWLDTEELANKQDDLVEDAQDMLSDGEMLDEDWIDDQKDIADEISDALSEENPEAMKDKLEDVKKATEKLAKDAEELADLQDQLGEATKDESLEKLKDTVEDALQNGESSEKWDEAKEAVDEGDFDEAMAIAQEAIDDQAKDLAKDAQELETIGDMLTDNQELNDANSKVSDLAEQAQNETDKASEMADGIDEPSKAEQAQQKAQTAQAEAEKAQSEAEAAQQVAKDAKAEAKSAPSEMANEKVQEAQKAVSEAQTKAQEAKQDADEAQSEATKAQAEAQSSEENQSTSEATPEEQQVMQGQQEKAADALSDVSEGLEKSKSALEEQIAALNEQIEAQAQAAAQSQSQPPMDTPMDEAMQAAMQAALDAQQAMDLSEMMPQSEASQAQQAAQQAQSKALEAMTEAQKAQAQAMSAEPSDAAKAQADAAQAQSEAEAAQSEAEVAQAEAQSALDAQPSTPEMSAAQAAQSEAQAAQGEASQAQESASESQSAAQEAMSAAIESPSEEATSAAQQAQSDAAQAQTEAKAAQQAAQQSQSQAQQATQQADAAMMQAQQAMMQAQAAQQALNEVMAQQAQQLGMSQQQMQSMASMNQPSKPSQQPSQQQTPPGQPSDNAQNKPAKLENGVIDLELLKNIGLTLEDWEKIMGGLKSGVTSEGDFDNVPAEYRILVREYFREIASQVQEK